MGIKILKFKFTIFICFFLSVVFSLSCGGDSAVNKKSSDDFFSDNPPSISWSSGSGAEIMSYEADVSVYQMNNRRETGATLKEKYRISMKKISGRIYSRLDFDPAFNNGEKRSVMSDGREVVLFDTETEEVSQRVFIADQVSGDIASLMGDTYMGRVNLSLIRSEAFRLSFDVAEDTAKDSLTISLPSSLLNGQSAAERVSTKIAFDTADETLQSAEIVERTEDGTETRTTITMLYDEMDGEPVKIGEVCVIDTKVPELIKGFDEDYPVYNSPDDIPTIDNEILDQMIAEGSAVENNYMIFGNPADLSSTETIITICNDIDINDASDKLFKLMAGGK